MPKTTYMPAPTPTVRRFPEYLDVLRRALLRDREFISGTRIANELKLEPIQVRKDLAVVGVAGRPGVGFPVRELVEALMDFLGWNNGTDAFLIGAGSLAAALAGFHGFKQHGLNIVAAFDVDPAKVGGQLKGKEVFSMNHLVELTQRMHVHIGVLTVPDAAAQEATDQMLKAGIRAIWNFTSVKLNVPPQIIVENVQLASSFAVLSSRLVQALQQNPRQDGVEQ